MLLLVLVPLLNLALRVHPTVFELHHQSAGSIGTTRPERCSLEQFGRRMKRVINKAAACSGVAPEERGIREWLGGWLGLSVSIRRRLGIHGAREYISRVRSFVRGGTEAWGVCLNRHLGDGLSPVPLCSRDWQLAATEQADE